MAPIEKGLVISFVFMVTWDLKHKLHPLTVVIIIILTAILLAVIVPDRGYGNLCDPYHVY